MDGTCGCSAPPQTTFLSLSRAHAGRGGLPAAFSLCLPFPPLLSSDLTPYPQLPVWLLYTSCPEDQESPKGDRNLSPQVSTLTSWDIPCLYALGQLLFFFFKELEVPHGLGGDSPWRNILTSACRMCPPQKLHGRHAPFRVR